MQDFDLPDILKYRCLVMFKASLPIKSGNLRHNAATMFRRHPGATYFIDQSEADYTHAVFLWYKRRGHNFMYDAAFHMWRIIAMHYYGGRIQSDEHYLLARENVLASAQSNREREIVNAMHGTGLFASRAVRDEVLETQKQYEVDDLFNNLIYGGRMRR